MRAVADGRRKSEMSKTDSNVVSLYETNYRNPVSALRQIADDIENGKYGDVGCVSIAVLGDTMEIFGAGPDSDPAPVAMLFHAAFMRLSLSIEEHGL